MGASAQLDELVGAVEQLVRGVIVDEPPQGAEVVDVGLSDRPVELVDPRDHLLGVRGTRCVRRGCAFG